MPSIGQCYNHPEHLSFYKTNEMYAEFHTYQAELGGVENLQKQKWFIMQDQNRNLIFLVWLSCLPVPALDVYQMKKFINKVFNYNF